MKSCPDCWHPYEPDAFERAWYEARDLVPPRRCKPCRAARHEQRAQEVRLDGIVESFARGAEYGFIIGAPDGAEYFFRASDVPASEGTLVAGDAVTFCVGVRSSGPHGRASLVKRNPGSS